MTAKKRTKKPKPGKAKPPSVAQLEQSNLFLTSRNASLVEINAELAEAKAALMQREKERRASANGERTLRDHKREVVLNHVTASLKLLIDLLSTEL